MTVQSEGFTSRFAARVCILRTDGDVACHATAVRCMVLTILDRTMDMLDFFLFHHALLLSLFDFSLAAFQSYISGKNW